MTESRGPGSATLSSADIVRQLYLRNCTLCAMTKYVLTANLNNIKKNECEQSVELIEAMHLCGATTVLYPLFGYTDCRNGITSPESLGQLLILLQVYAILPSLSNEPSSITAAVRTSSLWLRSVTYDQVVEFLTNNTHVQSADREYLRTALEGMRVSSNGAVRSGDYKLFSHPYYWGAFAVSGHGGGVQPLSVFVPMDQAQDERRRERLARKKEKREKKDLRDETNIRFEIAALRAEGKKQEAEQLKRGLDEIHR